LAGERQPDSLAADPNREVFIDDSVLAALEPDAAQPGQFAPTVPSGSAAGRAGPRSRRRLGLSRRQLILLIGGFLIWCVIMLVFIYLIAQDVSF
jgi:hypothetical protein